MSFAISTLNPSSLPLPSSAARPADCRRWQIKATGSQRSDHLDHLQRESKKQQSQSSHRRTSSSTPISLWDRFPSARTIQQMVDTMDRVTGEPSAYAASSFAPRDSPFARGRTPWEIREGEGEFSMRFDMPGMTRKDAQVWVEDNVLVIKAEKQPAKEDQEVGEGEEGWPPASYGSYRLRIALPKNVAVEKISAEVKDGVLYVTVPKISTRRNILDISVK